MKIISFSLWGNSPKYLDGAVLNAKEAKNIYPDWTCRFYCDNTVPMSYINALKNLGSEIVLIQSEGNWDGLFWRFEAMDSDVEAVIIRDTDSIVNDREKEAVNDWLSSSYPLHGMRDHLEHNVPIMGGMWGCKNPKDLFMGQFTQIMQNWKQTQTPAKGLDQSFLANVIWPEYQSLILVHDRFNGRAFKLPNGDVLGYDMVTFYDPMDNAIGGYPRGRIDFRDRGSFQRLDVYEYNAQKYFGNHKIKPFPDHLPIKYGTYVGETYQ